MLSKIERRKIALRNLRKAHAALRSKGVRKNARIRYPRAPFKVISEHTVVATTKRLAEKHGAETILRSAAYWCWQNAIALEKRGFISDAHAYRLLSQRINRIKITAKGM